ncbi:MAG: hypothetical protein HUJ30_00830 [Gammaproteobacteria bacterium]|nr:hypothetical protein [Gammaproteobacteria bacterium]
MATVNRPQIGSWYQSESMEQFEVVALDENEQSIEIQYFNGDVEELDLDTWELMSLTEIQAPEDWSGPFDDLVRDDFGDTERPFHPQDWASPVETIESDIEIDLEE